MHRAHSERILLGFDIFHTEQSWATNGDYYITSSVHRSKPEAALAIGGPVVEPVVGQIGFRVHPRCHLARAGIEAGEASLQGKHKACAGIQSKRSWLVDEMYRQYLGNPRSVPEEWRKLFAAGPPGAGLATPSANGQFPDPAPSALTPAPAAVAETPAPAPATETPAPTPPAPARR